MGKRRDLAGFEHGMIVGAGGHGTSEKQVHGYQGE